MRSKAFSIQGHRGARGHFPENTVTGFLNTLDFGVDAIELDVVISGDEQVVVSHEPWMNELICSYPDGTPLETGKEKTFNLFRMSYAEIRQFDCGRTGNPGFPSQQPLPASKPLLREVITEVEKKILAHQLFPVTYNIEIKVEADGLYNPEPGKFASLVYNEVIKYLAPERFMIQSFDDRVLKAMRMIDKHISIGLLVENQRGFDENIGRLGFTPDFYNPDFTLVDHKLVEQVHLKGIKLIPWTVNETEDMSRLIALGVDGIISDFPDRLIKLINT